MLRPSSLIPALLRFPQTEDSSFRFARLIIIKFARHGTSARHYLGEVRHPGRERVRHRPSRPLLTRRLRASPTPVHPPHRRRPPPRSTRRQHGHHESDPPRKRPAVQHRSALAGCARGRVGRVEADERGGEPHGAHSAVQPVQVRDPERQLDVHAPVLERGHVPLPLPRRRGRHVHRRYVAQWGPLLALQLECADDCKRQRELRAWCTPCG